MNATAEARLSELDRVLNAQEQSPDLAAELFAVADLLGGQAQLRNAMADPTVADDRRSEFANQVFGGRVGKPAAAVVAGYRPPASNVRCVSGLGGITAVPAVLSPAGYRPIRLRRLLEHA